MRDYAADRGTVGQSKSPRRRSACVLDQRIGRQATGLLERTMNETKEKGRVQRKLAGLEHGRLLMVSIVKMHMCVIVWCNSEVGRSREQFTRKMVQEKWIFD